MRSRSYGYIYVVRWYLLMFAGDIYAIGSASDSTAVVSEVEPRRPHKIADAWKIHNISVTISAFWWIYCLSLFIHFAYCSNSVYGCIRVICVCSVHDWILSSVSYNNKSICCVDCHFSDANFFRLIRWWQHIVLRLLLQFVYVNSLSSLVFDSW